MLTSTSPYEPLIRLPRVEPGEAEKVWDELERKRAAAPEFEVVLSENEAWRAQAKLSKGTGPVSHAEALWLIVPIVESLFDDGEMSYGIPFHVQLMIMCSYPSISEALALQVAFGRTIGEDQSTKIARLADRARRRGLSVDEYVEYLRATDAVPHDRVNRLFLGESARKPMDERLRRAIALLRRTAALSPEAIRPQILSAIAWMLWALGKRALSLVYLAEALRIEPQSPLARGLTAHFHQRSPAWLSSGIQGSDDV